MSVGNRTLCIVSHALAMSSKDASNFMFLASQTSSSVRHVERLVAQSVFLTFPLFSSSSSTCDSSSDENKSGPKKCFTIDGGKKSTYFRCSNSGLSHAIRNENSDPQLFDTVCSREEFDEFFEVVHEYIAKPLNITNTNDHPEPESWL